MQLLERNENLEKRLTELEKKQYSRRENLELHGIPEIPDENTDNVVMKRIDEDITAGDIEVTHRVGRQDIQAQASNGTGQRRTRPRPIIVRFTRRQKRDKIYKDRKNIKNTTTDMLGYTVKNNIFVNENLTTYRRNLLRQSNEKRKALRYKFLWSYNGTIYVKKDQGMRSIIIRNERDLMKIV